MHLKIKELEESKFSLRLLDWYQQNKRELPWRQTKDPYKIWLSEILLQQTRVAQGLPYYERFIERFPTIDALAKASEMEVLALWQGLGYYSRARNLHACANKIVDEFASEFPSKYNELLHLPGIGKYTAAAIASFAFGEKVPVIDGNVYRVLSRYFGIYEDIADAKNFTLFFKLSQEHISSSLPDIYNQAIMEFGALQCSPKKPNCAICPLSDSCHALHKKEQDTLPVKGKKTKVKELFFNYFVLTDEEHILMNHRSEKDIWQNMYDFPHLISHERKDEDKIIAHIKTYFQINQLQLELSDEITHILSHRKIRARFFRCFISDFNEINCHHHRLFHHEELSDLPKPVLIQNYLRTLKF